MVLQSLTGAERRVRLSEWPLWSTWESRLSNALPGSMADYSAPAGLFDGLEWATGSMNMFIRRVIGYAVETYVVGTHRNGKQGHFILRTWQVMGVSISAQPAIGLPQGDKAARANDPPVGGVSA